MQLRWAILGFCGVCLTAVAFKNSSTTVRTVSDVATVHSSSAPVAQVEPTLPVLDPTQILAMAEAYKLERAGLPPAIGSAVEHALPSPCKGSGNETVQDAQLSGVVIAGMLAERYGCGVAAASAGWKVYRLGNKAHAGYLKHAEVEQLLREFGLPKKPAQSWSKGLLKGLKSGTSRAGGAVLVVWGVYDIFSAAAEAATGPVDPSISPEDLLIPPSSLKAILDESSRGTEQPQ